MESKESARLKEIKDELRGIRSQLTEQNRYLKKLVDIFGQLLTPTSMTINDDGIMVTPYRSVDVADEMRQEEKNELQ